ncbi:MAG: Gfo/Idh/MocA family oxidoreductase, partial [Ruminococcaceae bacterium]|nr:Gfo/Idh/MocA family oxidoreductase [Oscillospiraceae bacterium]
FAELPVFSSATAMMDSGLVDAICVAVPHYDHPTLAIEAMQKGLHVMIEKPAGVYTQQVLEMNRVAESAGVTFAIMMNQRTNCIYRKMRELVQSGELGAIRRTSWIITDWYRPQAYYNSGDWRATWSGEGGGVLLNQCPHQLDLWQWICGMPKSIYAKMHFGKWHDIEVEDDVTIYAEYENGATGTFITSTGDTPGTNRFEITLEKGKLIAEKGKLFMWKSENGMSEPEFSAVNTAPFGNMKFAFSEVETDGENPQHMGVFRAFAANILRGEALVANGAEGINGLTISNACHLSAFTGREIELATFDHETYRKLLMEKVATSRRKAPSSTVTAASMDDTF